MRFTWQKHQLQFNFPAGTSRGVLTCKTLWLISFSHQGKTGIGECSIIEGLTPFYENDVQFESLIKQCLEPLNSFGGTPRELLNKLDEINPSLKQYAPILFAIECALFSWLSENNNILFDNSFSRGTNGIPINGLIWMGDIEWMREQVRQKIMDGYSVLKFKIGALDWNQELALISAVREKYSADDLSIRVDANGAFNSENVHRVLESLKDLQVHSIEQPVHPQDTALLKALCREAIIPIALDESLISCTTQNEKEQLLDELKPQFIVLKPSLHGGLSGVKQWIELAENQGISWWITSALESNIGLTAIAQFCGNYKVLIPQGLGTGSLFVENFPSNLVIHNGAIRHYLPEQG